MTKEELLKEIMKLPKVETNNPISTMTGINIDDLMNAVDRLNKVPDYNDLLKENQELKEKYENAVADYENVMFEKEQLKKQLEVSNELVAQDTLIEMKLRNEFNRRRKEYQDTYKDVRIEIKEYKTQQKKFIEYLEDNWKQTQDIWYIKILQKYKKIIGE
jgi:predicted nuclease with TOPRIM domain